jgi:predicted Rossmann fold nucleotide-binding protein DprA/Smf involved in DNA uptake
VLADAPATADELVGALGLPAADVAPALTTLELAGLIMEAEGLYRAVMPAG